MEYTKILGKVTLTCDGLHDSSKEYNRLSLVYDTLYRSFISIKEVPTDISLFNLSYWQPISTLTADGEDLYIDNDLKLKFADKEYKPSAYSGQGRKHLRKKIVGGKNVLTQSVINKENTIYIVQYEFDLQGGTIIMPEGCTLDFKGGSFTNGNVVMNDTLVLPFGIDIYNSITGSISGTFKEGLVYFDSHKDSLIAVVNNKLIDLSTPNVVNQYTRFNWIKYANNEFGDEMTDKPQQDTTHIGIASNKETEQPSNNPLDYIWSRFTGPAGNPGPIGPEGRMGPEGKPGRDGADGQPGKDGIAGKPDWKTFVFKLSDVQPSKPTFSKPVPGPAGINGWMDGPSTEGKWWMSVGDVDGEADQVRTWSDPVQCTAEDGHTNSYIDFKYAITDDPILEPALDKSVRQPSGWYDKPPVLPKGWFMWMTHALIDENDQLVHNWQDPIRVTGETGELGNPGESVPGTAYNTVFAFISSIDEPDAPVGGTWDALTNVVTYPEGWKGNDEKLTPPVWQSNKVFTSDPAILGEWSPPLKISGSDGKPGADGIGDEFIYTRTATSELMDIPDTPPSVDTPDYIPELWTDNPKGVTPELRAEWVCTRSKKEGVWLPWSNPALWSTFGKNGQDGDGIQYIFYRTELNAMPINPTPDDINSDRYQETGEFTNIEFVPTSPVKWTDNPQGVTKELQYEWQCQRKYRGGKWKPYTGPSLWSKYGKDGLDGLGSIVVDLDNEVQSIACDSLGNVLSGLPVTTTMTIYYGTTKLSLIDIVITPIAGIVATADRSTGLISVTSIAGSVPPNINIPITGVCMHNNEIIERTATLTINKVQPGADGADAILYQLVPSTNIIHLDKKGIPDVTYISCGVKKTLGQVTELITQLPTGYSMEIVLDDDVTEVYDMGLQIPVARLKNKIEFVLYSKADTVVDKELIYKIKDGEDGAPGESVIVADLDNEIQSVACTVKGVVVSGLPVTTTFSMYYGTIKLSLDELTCTPPAGVTAVATASTGLVSVNAIALTAADAINVPIVGKGSYKGIQYIRTAVLTINKIKPGIDGETATLYSILPSTKQIHKNKEGVTNPTTINCNIQKIVGDRITNVTVPNGYTFTKAYDSAAAVPYNTGDNVSTKDFAKLITFELKNAGAVVVDREVVYIIEDGKDGADGESVVIADLDNEIQSVSCNADGAVTAGLPIDATFSMHYGTTKLTLESLNYTSIPGVTVSANKTTGLVTVSEITQAVEDSISINLVGKATHNGKSYTRTSILTIYKVRPGKDGNSPIIYQLLPNTNLIRINKNGVPSVSIVDCLILKKLGTTSTEVATPTGYTFTSKIDVSDAVTYIAGADINVNSVSSQIIFELKDSTSKVVDREIIYVIRDGTDGVDGSDGVDGIVPNWNTYIYKQLTTEPANPYPSSDIIPSGWEDKPNSSGQWWQCIGLVNGATNQVVTWSKVLPVNGLDGQPGTPGLDGIRTDFRFAKNTSKTNYPPIDFGSIDPDGWSYSTPALLNGEYLWMTSARISTVALIGTWSIPVRINGEDGTGAPGSSLYTWTKYSDNMPGSSSDVIYDKPNRYTRYIGIKYNNLRPEIQDPSSNDPMVYEWAQWRGDDGADGLPGLPGAPGISGRIIYPMGTYNPNTAYLCTSKKAPFILFEGKYYVMNVNMTWIGTNQSLNPALDAALGDNATTWMEMEKYSAVYTDLIIADGGSLGNFVFKGDQMFSQQGVDEGGKSTADYTNLNTAKLDFTLEIGSPGYYFDPYRSPESVDLIFGIDYLLFSKAKTTGESLICNPYRYLTSKELPSFIIKLTDWNDSGLVLIYKYYTLDLNGNMQLNVKEMSSNGNYTVPSGILNTAAEYRLDGVFIKPTSLKTFSTPRPIATFVAKTFIPNYSVNSKTGEVNMVKGSIKVALGSGTVGWALTSSSEINATLDDSAAAEMYHIRIKNANFNPTDGVTRKIPITIRIPRHEIEKWKGRNAIFHFDCEYMSSNNGMLYHSFSPSEIKTSVLLRFIDSPVSTGGGEPPLSWFFKVICGGRKTENALIELLPNTLVLLRFSNDYKWSTSTNAIDSVNNKYRLTILNSAEFVTGLWYNPSRAEYLKTFVSRVME